VSPRVGLVLPAKVPGYRSCQWFSLYNTDRPVIDLPRGLRRRSAAARYASVAGSNPAEVSAVCLLS